MTVDEGLYDNPGFEALDLGENDAAGDRLESGGNNSKGVEKEIGFNDSMSESLSSGIGIFVARSSDSSSDPEARCKAAMDSDSLWTGMAAGVVRRGRGVGEEPLRAACVVGGDAGSAVATARRNVELLIVGDWAGDNGEDSRLR